MYRKTALTFAMALTSTAIFSCQTSESGKEAPVKPGSFQKVTGIAEVKAGNSEDVLVLQDVNTQSEYCLKNANFEVGQRVEYEGEARAVLPFKSEHCMELKDAKVEAMAAPVGE
ncbi:hypothetical protein FRD01_21995 [Microvenator marinus]|uniref:Uncharacterized protein n=2 Tax=Microvenator marinus TaxID=2600177 RepID=A0A5B8XW88_9DELT|nr:hypothetical protein FRD01_21995 [Microvenator marinus]